MSDLIPDITWTQFQKIVKDGKINELKSCNVTYNSEVIFAAAIPHGDIDIRTNQLATFQELGLRMNILGGKDPEEFDANIRDEVPAGA